MSDAATVRPPGLCLICGAILVEGPDGPVCFAHGSSETKVDRALHLGALIRLSATQQTALLSEMTPVELSEYMQRLGEGR